MRNILTLMTFSGLILSLNAQITISSSAMPSAGDTLRYSTTSALGLDSAWKKPGASQQWDFSKLTATSQGLYEYKSANKTPYAFYFFGQLGLKTADSLGAGPLVFKNIYSFYNKSTSVFKTDGVGYSYSGIPLSANYTDPDEVYQFPLQYHDSDVSTFRFVFSIPGQTVFSFVQAGKRTNVVDAYGSIKTPYGTYSDVIRVRTFVDEVDTIASQFLNTPIARRTLSYKWLATTEKIPVLEIIGSVSPKGVFTPNTINWRDKYLGGTTTNPLGINASFDVDKVKGTVSVDTFKFTNNTTPFASSYSWTFTPSTGVNFVNGTSANSKNPEVVFSMGATYSVKLKASVATSTDDTLRSDLIFVGWGVGTKEFEVANQWFPNPVSTVLNFNGIKRPKTVKIISSTGQIIEPNWKNETSINVENLANGIYLLQTENYSFRFIKSN